MKKIVLCADDYGQNNVVSQAIVELIEKKHLSATSCITTEADFPQHAKQLRPFIDQIDLGLHFNLTEGEKFQGLGKLMISAFLKRLNKQDIERELKSQLHQFEACFGRLPDYIDGHQHIHQLPQIREVIVENWQAPMYIRSTDNPRVWGDWKKPSYLKRLIIQASGAKALKNLLEQRGIPHNTNFEGVRSFQAKTSFRHSFLQFLETIESGGIIMCHPGLKSEYDYFSSDEFNADCDSKKIKLVRFRGL